MPRSPQRQNGSAVMSPLLTGIQPLSGESMSSEAKSSEAKPTRRNFIKGAGSLVAVSASSAAANETSGPINLVYIHSHDSGRYLSPYGHNVPTPNLMRLARGGIL